MSQLLLLTLYKRNDKLTSDVYGFDVDDIISPIRLNSNVKSYFTARVLKDSPAGYSENNGRVDYEVEEGLNAITLQSKKLVKLTVISRRGAVMNSEIIVFNTSRICENIKPIFDDNGIEIGSMFFYNEGGDPLPVDYTVSQKVSDIYAAQISSGGAAITVNYIPQGTGSSITDGTWAYDTNDIYPLNAGAKIGSLTNPVDSIFMTGMVLASDSPSGYNTISTDKDFFLSNSDYTFGFIIVEEASGNIGLGNVIPVDARLHVLGENSSNTKFAVKFNNVSDTSLFAVRNDGNVGINTLAPTYKLDVQGTFNTESGSSFIRHTGTQVLAQVGDLHYLKLNRDNAFISELGGYTSAILVNTQSTSTMSINATNIWFKENLLIYFSRTDSVAYGWWDTVNGKMKFGSPGNVTVAPTSTMHLKGSGYEQLRLETSYTPTNSADANGLTGDVAWDTGYVYVKTGAGAWKRAALSSF